MLYANVLRIISEKNANKRQGKGEHTLPSSRVATKSIAEWLANISPLDVMAKQQESYYCPPFIYEKIQAQCHMTSNGRQRV